MEKNETQPNIIELVVHAARRKLYNLKKNVTNLYQNTSEHVDRALSIS
jgi:hypothetical protein